MWRSRRCRSRRDFLTRSRFEVLEPRLVLDAPGLAAIGDVALSAGAPIHVALDGSDADDDFLTYEVDVINSDLSNPISWSVADDNSPDGNRSMRISVTDFGDMLFELFEQRASEITSQIIDLATGDHPLVDGPFYDGLTFHRIASSTSSNGNREPFIIQGGDPDGDGGGGPGFQFDDQYHPDLLHTSAGTLSMAKSRDDTNGSQFFITARDTRNLDFNHSVFGFLTEGDAVRQEIAKVDVEAQSIFNREQSKPIEPVVIDSVTIFHDKQNAVLMLSAPEGTTGEADIVVTARDGDQTVQQTFHVTVAPDTSDGNPYLLPVDRLETTTGTPVDFQIPATDAEGDTIFYGAWDMADWPLPGTSWLDVRDPDLEVEVNPDTGQGTVTAGEGVAGVHGVLLGVNAWSSLDEATTDPSGLDPRFDPSLRISMSQTWDFQFVPVVIKPNAPTEIELLDLASNGNPLTNLNNTDGKNLRFRVHGTVPGAEVTIYADGVAIGHATALFDDVVVITDGNFELSHDSHTITADQALYDQKIQVGNLDNLNETVDLVSEVSSPLEITVDTEPPVITTQPVTAAAEGLAYWYDVNTPDEATGDVTYRLAEAPHGMLITFTAGRIAWTPDVGQAGEHSVVVLATDTAGNETRQPFQVTVSEAPKMDAIAPIVVDEGASIGFTAEATGQGDLVFSLDDGAPAAASILPNGDFSWTTTEADGPGTYLITVRVTNELGANSGQILSVRVNEQNEPPELSPIDDRTGDQAIDEGELLRFTAVATDVDLPANTLIFDLDPASRPEGASIGSTDGLFEWRPKESQGGQEYTITVRVWDDLSIPGQESFTVSVNEIDDPPEYAAVPAQTVSPGDQMQVTVTAWDPDDPANEIRYSLDQAPAGVRIEPASGEISWSVPEDFMLGRNLNEPVEITVRMTEIGPQGEEGLSATQAFKVVVIDPRAAAAAALVLSQAEVETELLAPLVVSRLVPAAGGGVSTSAAPEAPEPVGNAGLFNNAMGADWGLGGSEETPVENEDEGHPAGEEPGDEGDDERTDSEAERDEEETSHWISAWDELLAEIRDAALEQWAEDDDEGQGDEASPEEDETAVAADSGQPAPSPAGADEEPPSKEAPEQIAAA
ncbi:MAG: putative Ig domain-containing protein [Planctomycetota bacterium]